MDAKVGIGLPKFLLEVCLRYMLPWSYQEYGT